MFRGEFIRGDGLVIPNNVTTYGVTALLHMALRGSDSVLVAPAGNFYVGLCAGVPDTDLLVSDLTEPSIGTNGYTRKAVTRNSAGWPTPGTVNNEPFLETDWLTWVASGGDFSSAIQRLFLCASLDSLSADIIALSAALPSPITIGPSTPEGERRFKYRLFAGR